MKKIIFVLLLLFCFSLCSCGVFVDTNTAKSSELSEKYSFYQNSVSSIRGGCNVSPEEADEIFLVLVNDCGVDASMTVTPYRNAPYSVRYGTKTLTMTLDGNTVSEVFDGEKQIYPAAPADTSAPEENDAEKVTESTLDAIQDDCVFDFSSDMPFGEVDTGNLKLQSGELLSVIYNDGIVVVKAKIQPNLTNNLTISQNYYNVGDLVKNHGFNTCEELQYWAVADMTSGEEVKVISFDLNKSVIERLYNETLFENQLEDYVENLYIHVSLQK